MTYKKRILGRIFFAILGSMYRCEIQIDWFRFKHRYILSNNKYICLRKSVKELNDAEDDIVNTGSSKTETGCRRSLKLTESDMWHQNFKKLILFQPGRCN